MFDKLIQAQQKMEEIKNRLGLISVVGQAEGGKIKITLSGNKEVKEVAIDPDFYATADRETIEELILVAVNKAIGQAEQVGQTEMQAATQDMLGGMGGLADMFGGK